ncbi:MAG: hypothetical protein AMJ84_06495 [Acidithiobacillales bacterium SM23_46]|nr:MAG: hypothetical protein AMJ84_06495 [Acidithiobacillales bacterium SM23_46]
MTETLDTLATHEFVAHGLAAAFHARTITYHPNGGDDVSRNGVFEEQQGIEGLDDRGNKRWVRTGTLWIAADATNGVASPQLADEVTIASEKWSVVSYVKQAGVWELELRRSAPLTRGATGYTLRPV